MSTCPKITSQIKTSSPVCVSLKMSSLPSGDFPEADDDIEFAFNLNGQLKPPPLSAAELFDGGKIRPLKLLLPVRSQYWGSSDSPPSPKRMLTKAFISTRQKDQSKCCLSEPTKIQQISKETQSLSSSSSSSSSSSWSRKWRLLFRSASEGHATGKDGSSNSFLRKSHVKNFSFRSEDGSNSGSRSGRRKTAGRVSAHEWHYKKNRAAAEERRRKTFLPYKKNLLGCVDLDPVSRWIHAVEIKC